ncbi:hypothetical protein A2U01_0111330, partial [Trifolium medium]|nr:hypothetical protein [Trifolium medium]
GEARAVGLVIGEYSGDGED